MASYPIMWTGTSNLSNQLPTHYTLQIFPFNRALTKSPILLPCMTSLNFSFFILTGDHSQIPIFIKSLFRNSFPFTQTVHSDYPFFKNNNLVLSFTFTIFLHTLSKQYTIPSKSSTDSVNKSPLSTYSNLNRQVSIWKHLFESQKLWDMIVIQEYLVNYN